MTSTATNISTLKKISQGTKTLVRVASIIGAITIIAGGYSFYLNNIWKPDVEVTFVDYINGVAYFKFRGRTYMLEGDSTILLDGDWGVRFGTKMEGGKTIYKGIELVKKSMVYELVKR